MNFPQARANMNKIRELTENLGDQPDRPDYWVLDVLDRAKTPLILVDKNPTFPAGYEVLFANFAAEELGAQPGDDVVRIQGERSKFCVQGSRNTRFQMLADLGGSLLFLTSERNRRGCNTRDEFS